MEESTTSTTLLLELLTACNISLGYLREAYGISDAEIETLKAGKPLPIHTVSKIESALYERPSYLKGNDPGQHAAGMG